MKAPPMPRLGLTQRAQTTPNMNPLDNHTSINPERLSLQSVTAWINLPGRMEVAGPGPKPQVRAFRGLQ